MCVHLPLSTCSLLCAKFYEKTQIGRLIDGFVYLFIYSSFTVNLTCMNSPQHIVIYISRIKQTHQLYATEMSERNSLCT